MHSIGLIKTKYQRTVISGLQNFATEVTSRNLITYSEMHQQIGSRLVGPAP